jgi:endonuclease-3
MSAQTTDKQVNKANEKFFKVLKTPEDWVNLWVEKIKSYIKTIGFFNNKSQNIYKTCKILVEKYNSKIPKTFEELIELPWIWVKTAKVFLALTEDAPYIWVDTHVHRVLNRLWLVKTKSPLETDKIISKWFTKNDHARLHHTLVLFWRYVCIARKPKCQECPFKSKCDYFKKSENLENL